MSKDYTFNPGDFVVYPAHGVGQVKEIQKTVVSGQNLDLIAIHFNKDKMMLRIPLASAQKSGLRQVSDTSVMDIAEHTLRGKSKVKRTQWTKRAQEYDAKIIDDEKPESIEKQIANQKYPKPESKIESTPKEEINSKVESIPKQEITSKHESNNKSEFPDVNQLYNQDEQFIDLDKLDNNYEDDYYNQVNFEPDPFEVDNLIKRGKESETTTIIMCNDVGEIMGVDEKVYGPFHSQDVVVLPKLNAKIFLDTNQARLVNL